MKLRRFLFPALAVAISLTTASLVLELALRLWAPAQIRLFPRYHEAVRYGEYMLRRTRPSSGFVHTSRDGSWTFAINAQGFRSSRDYSYARTPGVRRVLVLGDSQALGYENRVEEILPERLSGELRERGIRAEVLNTGVSGFGTAEELVFLEQEGLRYRPDLVVLMFFKNDYADNVRSRLFAVNGGRLVRRSKSYAPGTGILAAVNSVPPLRWLSENSYLYSFLFNTGWNLAKEISNRQASHDPFERTFARGDVPPHQRELAAHLLTRLHLLLTSRRIPLVIVDVPNIPPGARPGEFESSIASGDERVFNAAAAKLVGSKRILGAYRGRVAFHRPNGERHVTPFVHARLASAAAEAIQPLLAERAP